MKHLFFLISVLGILAASLLGVADIASAQTIDQQLGAFTGNQGANLGTPTDPRTAIARFIRNLLAVMGLLMIVLIVYAGATIMTSQGNEEKIAKGKKTIVGAVIGLFIVLSAYAITLLVTRVLLGTQRQEGFDACIQRPSNIQKDILGENINEGSMQQFIPYCDTL